MLPVFLKAEVYCQLWFSSDCDVAIKMKFFLQLQPLMVCVHNSIFLLVLVLPKKLEINE